MSLESVLLVASTALAAAGSVGAVLAVFSRTRETDAERVRAWAREVFAPKADFTRLEQKVDALESELAFIRDGVSELLRRGEPR